MSARPSQDNPGALGRVSNAGRPYVTGLPGDERVLHQLRREGGENARIVIMGQRNGRAFYRIDAQCFATGPVLPAAQSFGAVVCSPEFPSPARPILDFTVFHGGSTTDGRPPANMKVYRSEGFAADGVASVAFVDEAGALVAETAVVGNTYSFERAPSGGNLRIAAIDRAGERIFEAPRRSTISTAP